MKRPLILMVLFIFVVLQGCGKEKSIGVTLPVEAPIPEVKIEAIKTADINFTSVKISGTIVLKGTIVLTRGLCYSTTANPTINDNKTTEVSDNFKAQIPNLTANTKYFVKTYVVNKNGTYYSDEVNFSTRSLAGTLWDFRLNDGYNTYADVNFYADGTTRFDEPPYPGVYLSYGGWSLKGNAISYNLFGPIPANPSTLGSYYFTGTIGDGTMTGTYTFGTENKSWTATLK